MCNSALFFQHVHLIEVKDWEHIAFVSMLPAYTATTALSMLVAGWAIDQWGTGRLMQFFLLPLAGGFLVFWIAEPIM